jgi:hypothetical protein
MPKFARWQRVKVVNGHHRQVSNLIGKSGIIVRIHEAKLFGHDLDIYIVMIDGKPIPLWASEIELVVILSKSQPVS